MCLGLLKEVEFLAKEKLELQYQAEKDHSSLRAQMKVLEVELEEQMHQNQKLAKKSMEVTDLRLQIQVLEKQLRNQRQFMDVSKLNTQLLQLWRGKHFLLLCDKTSRMVLILSKIRLFYVSPCKTQGNCLSILKSFPDL